MRFGYEVIVLLEFVFLYFGRWEFVDFTDNQFEAVVKLEKILRDFASSWSQKFLLQFFVITQTNGHSFHETADHISFFFIDVLEARINGQYSCQDGMYERTVLDHFEHLLFLLCKITIDLDVLCFGDEGRMQGDDCLRYFFQYFIVHFLVGEFLFVPKGKRRVDKEGVPWLIRRFMPVGFFMGVFGVWQLFETHLWFELC